MKEEWNPGFWKVPPKTVFWKLGYLMKRSGIVMKIKKYTARNKNKIIVNTVKIYELLNLST